MKKIDEDKINAVGKALGVGFSEAKQTRRQKARKIIFGIIQGLLPLGSTFLGISLGSANSGYPYAPSFSPWDDFGLGLLFETVAHSGNGLFLLPKEMRFGFSRSTRIRIFMGNLVLSIVLFVISFGIHSNWWSTTPGNTLYSAYENQWNSRRQELIEEKQGSKS